MPALRRYRLRRAAAATAIGLGALATPAPASADDPLTTVSNAGADTVAIGVESVADALAGCLPVVRSWSPEPLTYTPVVQGDSVWYEIKGGGTAHLNCTAQVLARARVSDVSAPPYLPYVGAYTTKAQTSADPVVTGSVAVPYVGPAAPVLRPVGQVTVRVEVFRRLRTGRYAPMHYGCMEWHYVLQPAASLVVTDPSSQGACKHDALYLAADTVGSVSQAERGTAR